MFYDKDLKTIITKFPYFKNGQYIQEARLSNSEYAESLNIIKLTFQGDKIDRRYYVTRDIINETAKTLSLESIQRPINLIKNDIIKNIRNKAGSLLVKPLVLSSLGFYVQGSEKDILSLQMGKAAGILEIKDAYNNYHTITVEDYDTIINEILAYRGAIIKKRFDKEKEVNAMETFEELYAYDNQPTTRRKLVKGKYVTVDGTISSALLNW